MDPNQVENMPAKKKRDPIEMLFKKYDKDKSGSVSKLEIKLMFEELGMKFTPEQFELQIRHWDKDHDGTISLEEFRKQVSFKE